jgi:NTE family protein
MKRGRRVSLVLGSGGARGYAHIGVIEELEARGYEIVSVSGASMGALVGGFYACGKLRAYTDWVLELDALDVARLLDLSWSRRGLIDGKKLFAKLSEILGPCRIEELPIPYTAVATDLRRNREVWFQQGPLIEAIRASIAIPSFFTPVEKEGMLLVDGGVLNPLPVAPTMSDHRSDLTVAVHLYGEMPPPPVEHPESPSRPQSSLNRVIDPLLRQARSWLEEKNDGKSEGKEEDYHLFDIIDQAIDSMQKTLVGYRLGGYPPDLLIQIPKEVCDVYDFHKAAEVIAHGRYAARNALDEMEASRAGA